MATKDQLELKLKSGGNTFWVDRRAWSMARDLGIKAATAYLVLANGTDRNHPVTSWGALAVDRHTGLRRDQAATEALETLQAAGLISRRHQGSYKRTVFPAHEIQGCDGHPAMRLTDDEAALWSHLLSGPDRRQNVDRPARSIAERLVRKGYAKRGKGIAYEGLDAYDGEFAAKPQRIWLPKAIVERSANGASPLWRLRECGDLAALGLLVDLYEAQRLQHYGGVNWRELRVAYDRVPVADGPESTVWGFRKRGWRVRAGASFAARLSQVAGAGMSDREDPALGAFWEALEALFRLGLIEVVEHVVSSDDDDGDLCHPYSLLTGTAAELRLGTVGQIAARATLPADAVRLGREDLVLVRTDRHMRHTALVGVVRTTHLAETSATAAWRDKEPGWNLTADNLDRVAKASVLVHIKGTLQGKAS